MAINKDEVVSELLQKVWGILTAKFPDKHLEITYWPLLLPVATFEENLGAPTLMLSMAKNSIESCIGMMVASICEDVGGRPFTIDVSTKAWEEGMSSFQFGFSSKSENVARQQLATRADLRRLCKKHTGTGVLEIENTGQRLTKTTLIVASCMLGPFWLTPPLTAGHTASSRGQAHVGVLFLARINCQVAIGIHLCYRRSAARLPRW